jgi:hypothetical protein
VPATKQRPQDFEYRALVVVARLAESFHTLPSSQWARRRAIVESRRRPSQQIQLRVR